MGMNSVSRMMVLWMKLHVLWGRRVPEDSRCGLHRGGEGEPQDEAEPPQIESYW